MRSQSRLITAAAVHAITGACLQVACEVETKTIEEAARRDRKNLTVGEAVARFDLESTNMMRERTNHSWPRR